MAQHNTVGVAVSLGRGIAGLPSQLSHHPREQIAVELEALGMSTSQLAQEEHGAEIERTVKRRSVA